MYLINIMAFSLICLFLIRPAHAYLDPGSGSFILQLAVGALLGGLVTLKIYFHKFKTFITGIFGKNKKHDHDKPNI